MTVRVIRLKKVGPDHDPRNRASAVQLLDKAQMEQLFITGLLYYEEPRPTLAETLHLSDTPLVDMGRGQTASFTGDVG